MQIMERERIEEKNESMNENQNIILKFKIDVKVIQTKAVKKIPQIEWIECLIKSLITVNHSLHGLHFYLIFETQLIHSLLYVRRTVAARLRSSFWSLRIP